MRMSRFSGTLCTLLLCASPVLAQDIMQYDVQRYEWTDYPQVIVYRYDAPDLRQLYLIADPTHQLAQLPIEGPSGRFVGKVRKSMSRFSFHRILQMWSRATSYQARHVRAILHASPRRAMPAMMLTSSGMESAGCILLVGNLGIIS